MINVLEKIHVSPIGLNDTLSERTYLLYLGHLDPNKNIFLKSDVDSFNKKQFQLDNDIVDNDTTFFSEIKFKFIERLKLRDSLIRNGVNSFTISEFDNADSFEVENVDYFSSVDQAKKYWNQRIKYKILNIWFDQLDSLDSKQLKEQLNVAFTQAKTDIECNLIFDNYDGLNVVLDELFLESIAESYDPHSSFFSEQKKSTFDDYLSVDTKGFGFSLEHEDGVFIISSMIPGSPAWNSNEINIGDQITKIHIDSNTFDLVCLDLYDVQDLLKSIHVQTVKFELLKLSGKKVQVTLTKEEIVNSDNSINAFLLEDSSSKFGYIALPSFYYSYEDENTVGCANDVAKEILKLKKDSIEGLILDLRDNGGGSLHEALDLAGIFLDYGNLGLIQNNEGKPFIMKDFNRGRSYRGPLIVLINSTSASASEVFARTIQTYNRGLIVGSTSFGKATGQIVLPTDTILWNNPNTMENSDEPVNYVKVTVSKIYDITGTSHQQQGVTPDIEINDFWDYFADKEKDYSYCISNSKLDKETFYKPYNEIPVSELSYLSKSRIERDSSFFLIGKEKKELDNYYEKIVPLQPESFYSYYQEFDKINEILDEEVFKENQVFGVKYPKYYDEISKMDDYFNEENKEIIEYIKTDPVLKEAFFILRDYVKLIKP